MARRLSMRLWRVAVRIFAQDSRDDADAQHDQREADQALGPVVQPLGQAHVHFKNGDAERGNCEGVTQGIGHAQPQSAAPVALYGGDVGDGGQMVVVEAVTQPQHQAGAKRGVEFPVARELVSRSPV